MCLYLITLFVFSLKYYFDLANTLQFKNRRMFVIYQMMSNSNIIIGYSINNKLIFPSKSEIQRTISNPSYLLWKQFARYWD